MTEYSAEMITVRNIPKLEFVGEKTCYRSYDYLFWEQLPNQSKLNSICNSLEKEFVFSKEEYELSEDIRITAFISIYRLTDNCAEIRISTIQPEETCVYLYGLQGLACKVEKLIGKVRSIQNDKREMWI
ncbi:MAG: hypothetical protein ACFB02_05100 [Mastigocoleus sp.]